MDDNELLATARRWREDDPDPETRAELDALLGLAEKGIGEIVALQRQVLATPPSPRS